MDALQALNELKNERLISSAFKKQLEIIEKALTQSTPTESVVVSLTEAQAKIADALKGLKGGASAKPSSKSGGGDIHRVGGGRPGKTAVEKKP